MTIAGTSAGAEARRLRGRAEEHRRKADEAEQRAGRYEIAERTEAETARVLAPLAGIGYHLLADRRWPGCKHAQVDMIVVGSAGVFIVDTKAWREISVDGGPIHRGQEDVTDDVARLADLVHRAKAALTEIGLSPGEVHAVVALARQRRMHAHVASVDVIGIHDLVGHIAKLNARSSAVRVGQVSAYADGAFPVAATNIKTLELRVIGASSSAAENYMTHGIGLFTAFKAVEVTDVPLEYQSVKETGSNACAS